MKNTQYSPVRIVWRQLVARCRLIWLALVAGVVAGLLAAPVGAADLATGLVAYLPCDGNAKDQSGYGHDGTVAGATLARDRFGNPNRAYAFRGAEKIELAGTTNLNLAEGGLTLSAWVNTADRRDGYVIIGKHNYGVSAGWVMMLNYDQPQFALGEPRCESPDPLMLDRWYHVVSVYDGVTQRLYIDGAMKAELPWTSLTPVDAPITVGCVTGGAFFRGRIDEVRVYNRALAAADVAALYAEEGGPNLPPSEIRLTGAVSFSTDELGTATGVAIWDMVPLNYIYNVWAAPGVPGGTPDGLTQPLLNAPETLALDVPLQAGRNSFTLFGAGGAGITGPIGINLFFDGVALPGISARATVRSGALVPPFQPNNANYTYDAVSDSVPGAGTVVYARNGVTVSLVEYYWSEAGTVYSVDRVSAGTPEADGGFDYVGLVTFEVQGLSESAAIVIPPQNQTVASGATAQFTVTAKGYPLPTFQWYKGTLKLTDGGNISGATTEILTLANVQSGDVGDYSVVVSNLLGSVTSPSVQLAVAGQEPQILQEPQACTVNVGDPASFAVTAVGSQPLAYQWFKDAVRLTDAGGVGGSASATLTLAAAQFDQAGAYYVEVTNDFGKDTSTQAVLVVKALSPNIVTPPESRMVLVGAAAVSFTVNASGTPPLFYQWQKNGENLADGGRLTGAQTATLTLTNVALTDTGDYWVVVTNAGGAATSIVAVLTVQDQAVTYIDPEVVRALELSFLTISGASHQFQSATQFDQWTNAGAAFSGDGYVVKQCFSMLAPAARFYRVQSTGVGNHCAAYTWAAASGRLPNEVSPAMPLQDASNPEDPVLADGELTLANDVRQEWLYYLQYGTNIQVPQKLIIEAEMRFVSGASEKTGRAPVGIGFTTAPFIGGLLGIGKDEVFLSLSADARGQTATVDTDDAYHRYRIEVDDSQVANSVIRVYQDDVQILTGNLLQGGANVADQPQFWFGEGTEWAYGVSQWRSFRHNALICTPNEVRLSWGPAVEIRWPTESNRSYQMQSVLGSHPNLWTNQGPPVTGTGSTVSIFDPVFGVIPKFFRIQVMP